jgi:hypothetical protein
MTRLYRIMIFKVLYLICVMLMRSHDGRREDVRIGIVKLVVFGELVVT